LEPFKKAEPPAGWTKFVVAAVEGSRFRNRNPPDPGMLIKESSAIVPSWQDRQARDTPWGWPELAPSKLGLV
jgi:hypothetical protein